MEQFRGGNEGVIGFLVGQVMKKTGELREPEARAAARCASASRASRRGRAGAPTAHAEPRYPWWQLVLLGIAGLAESRVWPLRRMWRSTEPLDAYGLVHLASVAGDALVAIALADSVFFSLPGGAGEGQGRAVPRAHDGAARGRRARCSSALLDRAGPRRAISFSAAAVRAVVAVIAAPRVDTLAAVPGSR